jgi:hypothetical protein
MELSAPAPPTDTLLTKFVAALVACADCGRNEDSFG